MSTKSISNLLLLMAALAAGTAAAAGNTPAGTSLTNTATVDFEDPDAPGTQSPTVTSNTVTTAVQAKPDFDVIYAGAPASDGTTPTTPISSHDKQNVLPGATVTTPYTILNNGNVGSNTPAATPYSVTVTPYLGGTVLPTGTVVQYYVGATKVYDSSDTAAFPGVINVPADDPLTPADEGQVALEQRVLVPASAPANADFAVSPRGRAGVYAAGTITVTDEPTGDLQYTRVRVYAPQIDVIPPSKDPGNPTNPLQTIVVPPSGPTGTPDPNYNPGNPGAPLNPVSPPGTPAGPQDPTVPGYIDPGNPGTSVAQPSTDNQIAYPPADTNAAPDVVTFVNTITNAGLADTVNLFPTDATGTPIGVNNNNGSFTLPGGVTVTFLKADGSPITTFYTDGSGRTYPTAALPAGTPGTPSVTNIRVQVTYPDSNSAPNPAPIVVVVGIDSGNDSGVVADGTSTDTILPPAMQFGDSNGAALGTDNAAVTSTQTVNPLVAPATSTAVSQNTTDRRAVFPMDLVNQGEYADSFTLAKATLSFPNVTGTTSTAPLRYVDASGAELPKDNAGNFVSPVVAPNEEFTVYAIVDVPADALAGTVLVPQKATGNYSTVEASDGDDVIRIAVVNTNPDPLTGNPSSGMDVDKYVTTGSAAPTGVPAEKGTLNVVPGDTLRYAIIAKNNFNAPVKNFVLGDSVGASTNIFTYASVVSVSATASFAGTVYYKVNGGAWTTVAPAAGTVVTSLQVAVDTDGSNSITAADTIPAAGSVRLDVVVTVK